MTTSQRCGACGKHNELGARYCEHCGTPLQRDQARSRGLLEGNYVLERGLAEGGMGCVYIAHRPEEPARKFAVKLLLANLKENREAVRRFWREAEIMAGLSHPNVMPIIERVEHDGELAIVMPYISGGTLRDWVDAHHEQRGALERDGLSELRRLFGGLLEGVSTLHSHQIVHRDLKPSNVLLTSADPKQPVICDLGIAHEGEDARTRLTRTSQGLGTLEYMSPEQHKGHSASKRSDVYALGMILFEMLSNALPFELSPNAQLYEIAQAHIGQRPRLSHLSVNIDRRVLDFLNVALAKDPDQRFPDASAMLAALPRDFFGVRDDTTYVREEEIGRGGMGVVWLAHPEDRPEHKVALKSIHPEHVGDMSIFGRFMREAQAMSEVNHPNIIPIIELCEDEHGFSIVMPFVGNGTLKERMEHMSHRRTQEGVSLSRGLADQIHHITSGLIAGLRALHEHDIIHRDVKPSNVLFDDKDNPVLCDLGVSKIDREGKTSYTHALTRPGTLRYMSPEQHKGKPASVQMDMYAVGLVLYEMLAGRFPFNVESSSSAWHIANIHITKTPELDYLPRNLSDGARQFIERALAKEPSERWDSTSTMFDEFQRVDLIKRPRWPWIVAAATAAIVLGGAVAVTWAGDEGERGAVDPGEADDATTLVSKERPEPQPPKPQEELHAPGELLPAPSRIAPEPEVWTWTIKSTPMGAEVYSPGNIYLGKTPHEYSVRAKEGEDFSVKVRKRRYKSKTIQLDHNVLDVLVELEKEERSTKERPKTSRPDRVKPVPLPTEGSRVKPVSLDEPEAGGVRPVKLE